MAMGRMHTHISRPSQCQKKRRPCQQSLERKKYDLGIFHLATDRCLKHERTQRVNTRVFHDKKKKFQLLQDNKMSLIKLGTENTKGRGKSTGNRLVSYLNTELRANN